MRSPTSSARRLVVSPAIPDQHRFVEAGCVVGRGVAEPIDVAGRFRHETRAVAVGDAGAASDLDAIVRDGDWARDLAVGARGLGAAFARSIGGPDASINAFVPHMKVLYALGTHDRSRSIRWTR